MSILGCNCKSECSIGAIIVSIIIGVVTAFLRFSAVITLTPAFLWVLFGISIVYLAITPITLAIIQSFSLRECICSVLPVLIAGILGTILLSVVLLAIEFVATSVLGAILTGALLTFFSLTVTSVACITKCTARCSE